MEKQIQNDTVEPADDPPPAARRPPPPRPCRRRRPQAARRSGRPPPARAPGRRAIGSSRRPAIAGSCATRTPLFLKRSYGPRAYGSRESDSFAASENSRHGAVEHDRLCAQPRRERALCFEWELKSVNAKGLDLRLRLPPGWDELEAPAREARRPRCWRAARSTPTSTVKRANARAGRAHQRGRCSPRC